MATSVALEEKKKELVELTAERDATSPPVKAGAETPEKVPPTGPESPFSGRIRTPLLVR